MQFICLSYSSALSLESAEKSRDVLRSDKFQMIYPELGIKEDKDRVGNFRVIKKLHKVEGRTARTFHGGNRFSTSIGGTLTGFHGHFIIWDDPINPQQAVSETELSNINRWMDNTLPTRKVNKIVSVTIGIMQRLHEDDPTGHILEKKKAKVKHICLPGEIHSYREQVQPPELIQYYKKGLLDPGRLNEEVLEELEADLGQYGYSGQVGQKPTPPGGGMFKVDNFVVIDQLPNPVNFQQTVRYWDKAGTKEDKNRKAAYTVGVKMSILTGNRFIVHDVKRGRWSSEEREDVILYTARADGIPVPVYFEQEPGSGGKESAEGTVRNLAGFAAYADLPRGDKVYRADPYSVQVNRGQVMLLRGDWNHDFIEEHRNFPHSTYKDQVDAAAGAFAKVTGKRIARML
jgi:predicted phage terminase large subunit-like protein